MPRPLPFLGVQLRPVVLWAAGVSAVTAYFLFSRWRRVLDQQRTTVDAATRTDACDGMDHLEQEVLPSFCVLIPEQSRREVDRGNRTFSSTYSKWSSDYRKLVEVKLQHKAIYNGLESEHWWLLINDFYHVRSLELPPQHFATTRAVAYIRCTGPFIVEAKIYLRAETTESSVQDVFLKTMVAITSKGVSVDEDGRWRCHDSSDSQTLEAPFVMSGRPRGPPPGF
ncbi:uncharacterized protein [Salminus brasiliensis]|uniref:uncharacterized protein n=1 Tax=Salminus brasiliensis TaxID=930266 RepID=UPI003B8394A0